MQQFFFKGTPPPRTTYQSSYRKNPRLYAAISSSISFPYSCNIRQPRIKKRKGIILFTGILLVCASITSTVLAQGRAGYFLHATGERPIELSGLNTFSSITTIDLGGDGQDEILLGAEAGTPPEVLLLRADGSTINHWLAYEETFRGGTRAIAADLNNDGKDEIITAPGPGGGPHIRIFDGYGKNPFTHGWFAFDKQNLSGIQIAALNIHAATPVILAALHDQKNIVFKMFTANGTEYGSTFSLGGTSAHSEFRIFALDSDADGSDEIGVIVYTAENPECIILSSTGKLIQRWTLDGLAGTNAVALDTTAQRILWVTRTGTLTASDFSGKKLQETTLTFPISPPFLTITQGNFTSQNQPELFLLHRRDITAHRTQEKYIEVSLNENRLRYYDKGVLQNEFVVSAGKPTTPTPTGEFAVRNKYMRAWSKRAHLWMPFWMAFSPDGSYGLHRLPEWPNGHVEGEDHLGKKVSGGCVRLGYDAAEELYNWSEVGTPIFIN